MADAVADRVYKRANVSRARFERGGAIQRVSGRTPLRLRRATDRAYRGGGKESIMAGSVNKVILIGNLGKDPEVRRLNFGDQVVNFTLATSENWRDKTSGERKEKTEWHNIVIFLALAAGLVAPVL